MGIIWEDLKLEKFETHCKNTGFDFEINNSNIVIKTGVGNWIVNYKKDSTTLELLHSNYLRNERKKKSEQIADYHLQREYSLFIEKDKHQTFFNKDCLMKILQYIKKHDSNKHKKDFEHYKRKNSRMDYLFSLI